MNVASKHIQRKILQLFAAMFISLLLAFSSVLVASLFNQNSFNYAYAADVGEAQNILEAAKAKLVAVQSEYDEAIEKANHYEKEVKGATQKAFETQNLLLEEQDSFNKIVCYEYRNGSVLAFLSMIFSATDFDSFIKNIDYANKIMKKKSETIQKYANTKKEFDQVVEDLTRANESYQSAAVSAGAKLAEAQAVVDEASAKLSQAEAEQLKQEAAQQTNPAPAPAPVPSPDPGGVWKSGSASAYTGGRTATGAPVTESSMGVAIPMSWPNYSSYFGHTVLIKYKGRTAIATINDCGGMGGGSRVLDLQPGVFHALGASSAYDWGVRTVDYQIL